MAISKLYDDWRADGAELPPAMYEFSGFGKLFLERKEANEEGKDKEKEKETPAEAEKEKGTSNVPATSEQRPITADNLTFTFVNIQQGTQSAVSVSRVPI